MAGPHQNQPVVVAGTPLEQAAAALILVHGRGATAQNILELADWLRHPELAYLAPQASGNTWYPYSFLAEIELNEPGLSSGLAVLSNLVEQVQMAGIERGRIIVGGFSQGACLASEFVARQAEPLAGLLAFSGGLIGPPGTPRDYAGSLSGMPAFLGCSDIDPHVPLPRVEETAAVLATLGAQVDKRIYPGMGHTINEDELSAAQALIEKALD